MTFGIDEDSIARCAEAFAIYCRERGYHVLPDGRVSEGVAAELLGIAEGTLANWRYAGTAPKAIRMGSRGSRWSYRLLDLAEFLECRSSDAN